MMDLASLSQKPPKIEWQIDDFIKRTRIECQFSSTLEDIDLDRDIATVLFRILQESLTNVVRHAAATHVTISIHEDNGRIVLMIEDNGRGIAESEIFDPKSLGLLGMRERAFIFGGETHIAGSEGRGTKVVVTIPHLRYGRHHA
jgi:two-component system, NarL family, sensor histidine kinase UhpB